jgi:hypothetical protein
VLRSAQHVSSITDGDGPSESGALSAPTPLGAVRPLERRQPQVDRRSVLPVEWFRRMPGGSTTYAPLTADQTAAEQVDGS